jgi:predicted alpha/beta-hydrolase family hydrolase
MEIEINTGAAGSVSGVLQKPPRARACYVFAHGAGAGMTQAFMAAVATGLFDRDIATLRYQFPYMQKGSKRPDSPSVAHAAVRAAVAEAGRRFPKLPLFAGGKSFGGRMTSQAQALHPLSGVSGLAFFGFPLHPPGKPSEDRAEHLFDIKIPMLFLQGGRDKLADLSLLEHVTSALGKRASLHVFEHADHSFHVPSRSGTNDRNIMRAMLEDAAAWILGLV